MPRPANLALQADLCYNGGRNIVVPGSAVNTPGRIHSWRNVPMTTVPPHADNSNPNDIPLKRCKKCGEEKPATTEFFHQRKGSKDGLRNDCIECFRAYQKAWRAENRDRSLARMRAYGATNRDQERVYRKNRYAEHRERIKVYKHNLRARKRAAEGTYTAQDVQNMLKGQKGKCANPKCGKRLVKYEVDHIVPLSRGGSNRPYNLQLLCCSCNRHKSNKLPHEFDGSGQMRLL